MKGYFFCLIICVYTLLYNSISAGANPPSTSRVIIKTMYATDDKLSHQIDSVIDIMTNVIIACRQNERLFKTDLISGDLIEDTIGVKTSPWAMKLKEFSENTRNNGVYELSYPLLECDETPFLRNDLNGTRFDIVYEQFFTANFSQSIYCLRTHNHKLYSRDSTWLKECGLFQLKRNIESCSAFVNFLPQPSILMYLDYYQDKLNILSIIFYDGCDSIILYNRPNGYDLIDYLKHDGRW